LLLRLAADVAVGFSELGLAFSLCLSHHFHNPPWKVGDNGIGQVNCPGSTIFHCIFCIFGVKFMLHLANLMLFFHNISGEGLQLNAEGTDMICVAICIN